jgi:hypothetical protein
MFLMPSDVFETKSRVPAIGLITKPLTPLIVPFTNPFNPYSYAPIIGFSKRPVTPPATPVIVDLKP